MPFWNPSRCSGFFRHKPPNSMDYPSINFPLLQNLTFWSVWSHCAGGCRNLCSVTTLDSWYFWMFASQAWWTWSSGDRVQQSVFTKLASGSGATLELHKAMLSCICTWILLLHTFLTCLLVIWLVFLMGFYLFVCWYYLFCDIFHSFENVIFTIRWRLLTSDW